MLWGGAADIASIVVGVSATFTTTAFDRSSLRWLEIST
jgi:hypothetical protein